MRMRCQVSLSTDTFCTLVPESERARQKKRARKGSWSAHGHLSLEHEPVSRGLGRSATATATAAYRAEELVYELTSDQVFDYSRKRGIEHSEIVMPSSAAKADINWARDRQALWNAAEIAEKRQDPRVAREYEVALAAQALEAANRAASEGDAWRHAHGVQAALHDRGMKQAPYLVLREAAMAQAKRMRAEALKAAGLAQAEFARARAEVQPRITQKTAPARAKVEELRQLAAAASKREDVAAAFERLAREVARMRNRDVSAEWKATPRVLRDAIERYNREPLQVQGEILRAIASGPEVAQKLEKAIEVRHAQVHDQDYGLGL